MMNGKRLFSAVVAAGLVGFVSFAAVGDVTTNEIMGVTEITANTTYGANVTLIGDGSFKVLNGKILTLEGTNSFTGGVVVENGYLVTLNSLNSKVNFAGTGDITLNCDGTKPCRWTYSSSICNNLIITGNSTKEFVATTQGGGSNLRGTVKAYGDYYVGVTGYDSRDDSYDSAKVSYANTVDVSDHTLAMSGHTMVQFNAKVLCDTLYGYYRIGTAARAKNGVKGGIYLAAANNDVKHVVLDHQKLWLKSGGAIDGATIRFEGQHFPMVSTDGEATTGYVNLNIDKGANVKQSFKWIESDDCPRTEGVGYDIRSSYTGGFTTLELTGEADKTADACVAISNKINLVIAESAPSSFRQIFRNRRSMMTGTIAVNGGALEVAGDASFEDVPSVTVAAGRELALKSSNAAFAGATAVTIGAGGKLVVDGANPFGGDTDLYICSDTIVDLATDVTVKRLFVDGVQRPSGTITDTHYFGKRGVGTLTVTEGDEPVPTLEVYVPENGVQTNVTGLAEGMLLVKFGKGTLLLTTANDYTGGTEVRDGVLETKHHLALGTGDVHVYGSTDHLVQLNLNNPGSDTARVPNNLIFETASTTNYPALYFGRYAYISGAVTVKQNLYLATWCDQNSNLGQTAAIKFYGLVTAVAGARIAGAPHTIVCFEGGVHTPILEGYYTEPGWAANGGNAGGFRLKNPAADTNQIGRIILDQTFVRCQASPCLRGTVLEWTGEHPAYGYGYFDVNGYEQSIGGIYTGENCADITEGLQITNSGNSAKVTVANNSGSSNWYCAFDGKLSVYTVGGGSTPTLKNRTHTFSGTFEGNRPGFVWGSGSRLPNVTKFSGASGGDTTFSSEEPDVFTPGRVTQIIPTSHKFRLDSAAVVRALSLGHQTQFYSNRGEGSTDYGIYVKAGEVLDVSSMYAHAKATSSKREWAPAGEYTFGDPENPYLDICRGTVRCWAARTAWTNIVWSGEADADLGDAANWTNTDDGAASAATFGLPLNKATIAGGSSAAVSGLVNFGKLTFAQEGDFTIGGEGIVAFYDDGLETVGSGRTITFNVPVDFQTNKLVVAAGDTVVFAAGFTNEVWEKAADGFTVSDGSAGRVELGGAVPMTLTVKGGTLGFAETAVMPADDTLVLDIADGAKIEVANGDILRVKSLKYKGAAVPVGYFTECVAGGGMIRVAESTAPAVPETLTWDHEGEGGLMSERTNWEGSPYFELSFADKYDFVFAKSGSEAVLDEPVTMHSLIFRNGPFAIRRGNDDAVIKLGTVDYVGTVGEAGVPHEYVVEPPLELVKNTMFSVAPDDTLVLNHLLGTATLTTSNGGSFVMKDMPEFTGGMSLKNANVFFTGTIGSEATAEGVEYLWRHKDETGGITTRCKITLSNAVFNAGINMSTPGATGSEDTQWMDVAEGTTNVFNRLVNPTATVTIRNRKDAWLIFEKGAQFAATANFSSITGTKTNPAVYDFKEKVTATSEAKGSLGLSGLYGLYIFEQVGNYAIRGMSLSAAFVDCRQPNQFQLENSTKRTGIVSSTTNSRLYLNNNREEFACLLMGAVTGGGPIIRGDYPATLAVVGGAITNSGSPSATIISDNNLQKVLFEGWVGLDVDVADDLGLKLIGTKSMSHGDLSVKSGELSLDAETLWPYGTNFTARGTGTLKFAAAGQINGDFAQLHVADNGKVYIPEGVTLRVSAADLDGQPVNAGTYETDGATGISAHLTGGGRLRVGKAGMMFIVK